MLKNFGIRKKATLKVGPLKTYDRGLQKVKETKDKLVALMDVLREQLYYVKILLWRHW